MRDVSWKKSVSNININKSVFKFLEQAYFFMDIISDYRAYAKQFYLCDFVTEQNFETDLQTMTRINTSIKRVLIGDGKVRLLMNQIITWFNMFEREAAIKMLMAKVDEENKPALVTILALMDYIPVNLAKELCAYHIDSGVAGLVYMELRGTHGAIQICDKQKHCA